MNETRTMPKGASLISLMCAMVLAFAMCVPAVSFAASDPVAADSKGSVTVTSGLGNGDVAKAYKVVTATYDADTNTVSYALVDGLSFNGKTGAEGAADYMALTDAAQIKAAVEGFLVTLKESNAAASGQVTATGESATIGDLDMGQYVLEVVPAPGSSDKVYQVTTANLVPEVKDGRYVLEDATVQEVKSTTVEIPKAIGTDPESTATTTDGYQNGDSIPFVLKPTVPVYPQSSAQTTVINKTFIVGDTMTSGLSMTDEQFNAITVKYQSTTLEKGTDYTIERDGNGFKITFDYDRVAQYAGFSLVVQYEATLNSTSATGVETNTATLTYARNPFDSGNYDTQTTVTDKTYGFYLLKKGSDGRVLSGATFEVKDSSGKLVGTITTNGDGYAGINGLKPGETYTIHETVVPAGYQAIEDQTIVISADDATLDYPATQEVESNYQNAGEITDAVQGSLPKTGSSGTLLITAAGVLLLAAALGLFFLARRKRTE